MKSTDFNTCEIHNKMFNMIRNFPNRGWGVQAKNCIFHIPILEFYIWRKESKIVQLFLILDKIINFGLSTNDSV